MGTFCQDCGSELASQYRFCPSCGGKNLGPTRPQTGSVTPPTAPPIPSNTTSTAAPSAARIVGATYAGFWRRVGAYVIDAIITAVPILLIEFLVAAADGSENVAALILAAIIEITIIWVYFALQESSAKQATIGKRAMGMLVCDMHGQRLGFGKATGRYFGKFLSGIFLGIGFIMVAFTDRKQGLHDLMAGTVVLHRVAD